MAAELDLMQAPLDGITLIEAAAGTGKTFAITGLYVRLLLECRLPVEQILVVTYTNAATAELRDRVRGRLAEVREAFASGSAGDDYGRGLLERFEGHDEAEARLRQALLDFDRAAIFTIHGFCQRVLADTAFESGLPFENELLADQQDLVQEVADDFWRTRVQDAPPGLLDYLVDQGVSPGRLATEISAWATRPFLAVRAPNAPALEALEAAFEQRFRDARALWPSAREEVMELLLTSPALNRNKYRPGSIEGWGASMDGLLADPPGAWFESFQKFTSATLAASVKKGAEPPRHPFFELCEALETARAARDAGFAARHAALRAELIAYARDELPRRKRERRLLAYDDLLANLHGALERDGDGGLGRRIRGTFQAALIDEFQDTDPLQYEIFDAIYAGTGAPVFLVGDPKQAIYSFRGADIFSYLRARDDADRVYTLSTNWRSVPSLVETVNALFDTDHPAFLFEEIGFGRAAPAPREMEALSGAGGAAVLRVGLLEPGLKKGEAAARAAAWTAAGVAELLGLDGEGGATLAGRPVSGGDIAVLVRSHRQAARMRDALARVGINSVQRTQESLFDSPEAEQMERVMRAVFAPNRPALLRAALATDLFGWDAAAIDRLNRDDALFERQVEGFGLLHRLWRESGFAAMAGELLAREAVAERLLGYAGGERRLTNLRHLVEVLHRESAAGRNTMDGLISWLHRRRTQPPGGEEEYQLRLESDEQLVQIVTIHKSKGLQYPVVFCPFAWDGGRRAVGAGEPFIYHDPEKGYAPVLELEPGLRPGNRLHARREELAEDLRLLYVALTRARHRCYLAWGAVAGADASALGWLLHPPASADTPGAVDDMKGRLDALEPKAMENRLARLAGRDPERVLVEPAATPAPTVPRPPPAVSSTPLAARTPRRPPGSRAWITSFSALTSGRLPPDQPDHDGDAEPPEPAAQGRGDIFGFPRGTRAGSCLHAVFERLDFARCTPDVVEGEVRAALEGFGFEARWVPAVCRTVEAVLDSELEPGRGVRLRGVGSDRRLVEMEFHFPLHRLDRAGLVRLLSKHGMAKGDAMNQALERLQFAPVAGYLRGFVDLVFESQGRFHLADYKSNWLGDETARYRPERLREEIARHDYYLQYLLYTVALHRYLGQRLAGYDYDRHFGAVFYIFLRGVDPVADPGAGIFRDRPERALVEALDRFLAEGGAG